MEDSDSDTGRKIIELKLLIIRALNNCSDISLLDFIYRILVYKQR